MAGKRDSVSWTSETYLAGGKSGHNSKHEALYIDPSKYYSASESTEVATQTPPLRSATKRKLKPWCRAILWISGLIFLCVFFVAIYQIASAPTRKALADETAAKEELVRILVQIQENDRARVAQVSELFKGISIPYLPRGPSPIIVTP